MREGEAAQPRRARPGTYAWFFLIFLLILLAGHARLLRLPYFWDEAGQFVPAALDLLRGGHWIPQSVPPNVHPPGVAAFLAAAWRVAGFDPAVTRTAMLLLSALGVLAAFLLAIELCREVKGAPALVAAGLLCVSPLFFAQSMLAQLDAPAMTFTCLALALFLRGRTGLSAAACVALVFMKETGLVVPAVLFARLAWERRWRDALYFAAPAAALAGWMVALKASTGHWLGSAAFARYNVEYPLAPARMAVTLVRRLYYLFGANFHWIGTAAILWAWRSGRAFGGRAWSIAWTIVAAQVVLVTVAGGAVLERYLLPVVPIVYAAMAAAISELRPRLRTAAAGALLAGVAAGNFINPPYPFPFEDNLAFADFVRLHRDAAGYLEQWYPRSEVHTAWPMTLELSSPDLGYVGRPMEVSAVAEMSLEALDRIDWSRVEVLAAFSRTWNPPFGTLRWPAWTQFWRRVYGYVPNVTEQECRARVPLELVAHFERRGQWVDIFVNRGYEGPGRVVARRSADRGARDGEILAQQD